MSDFISGKNVLLEYGSGDPLEWFPFLCGKSCEIALSQELLKKTDTVNGKFAAFIGVGISGTMTTSGLVKYNLDTLDPFDMVLNLSEIRVRFTINAADGSTVKYLQSYGFIQNLTLGTSVFSLAEQGLTIQLSGIIEPS